MEKGDYVVVNESGKRKLIQIEAIGDKTIIGTYEKDRQQNPTEATALKTDILAVIGPNPPTGSVFGVRVEPYFRTMHHDDWGEIHFYCKPSKQHWQAIRAGFSASWSVLDSMGLTGFVKKSNLRLEVKSSLGKNAGMYYARQKGENINDLMFIRLQETTHPDLYKEVILHEAGHGIFFRLFTPQQRVTWIKLHANFAQFSIHTKEDVLRIRKKYLVNRQFIKDFAASLEDAEALLFHECIGHICASYRLAAHNIDELMDANEIELLSEMWPKKELDYTDFENAITEYASKNHKELMAEAFRIWCTTKKLPSPIHAVLEKQLRNCKGRQ